MRIIIAGGRDYYNFDSLEDSCLDAITSLKEEGFDTSLETLEIISGDALGADKLGEGFAKKYHLKLKLMPADWGNLNAVPCSIRRNRRGQYNVLAGISRNRDMAVYASQDVVLGVLIAFWDGKSTGTKNMIEVAEEFGLRAFVIRY